MIVLKALLFLLKCLGILSLVLLGLLLLGILLALFAPVRYKGNIKKQEEPEEVLAVNGWITWLNPFLRVRIQYIGNKLRYTVRLLGICLLNSEKPKKEKQKKEKTKKEKRRKEKRKEKKKEAAEREENRSEAESGCEETMTGTQSESGVRETESAEGFGPASEKNAESAEIPEREAETENTESPEKQSDSGKKESFFAKIKKFFEKLAAIPGKIKQKIIQTGKTLKLLWYKKEKVGMFLQDEKHMLALSKGWNTVKKVFRHILPGKVKGFAEFGTGDPESTGKALAGLGILYAAYGKGITIVPDFYEKRLVADLSFRGRIRFGTLLFMGLGLIRDKQVKRFYRNAKKLIKILQQKAE